MRVELGGFKRKDWVTVNLDDDATIQHNLNNFPYPFEDNTVDELMMLHTLEHLDNPKQVMTEIYRICKPNTIVTIEVPYWKRDMWTNPEHKHYFKPEWFRSLNPNSRKYRNREKWCPYNFRVIKIKWIRGKHAKWRKYSLRVILKVVK